MCPEHHCVKSRGRNEAGIGTLLGHVSSLWGRGGGHKKSTGVAGATLAKVCWGGHAVW